ncbi:TPA: hypothetical protein ACJEU7_003727 [Acinetobacter baumannii]
MQNIVLEDVKKAMYIMSIKKDRPDYALALIKDVFESIKNNLDHPLKREVCAEIGKQKKPEAVGQKTCDNGFHLTEIEKARAISKIKKVRNEVLFINHVSYVLKITSKEVRSIIDGNSPFPVTFWNVMQKELSKFSIKA